MASQRGHFFCSRQPAPLGTYLLVSFEVNLLKRLVEPRLRVCDNGVASWDRLGEAGGPLYVAVRRSRGWPWKVLRLAVPLGKRIRSGVVALLILCVEATGVLWSGTELREQKHRFLRLHSQRPGFAANAARETLQSPYTFDIQWSNSALIIGVEGVFHGAWEKKVS